MSVREERENYEVGHKGTDLTFVEIFLNRYIPILSLTYIASLLGLALKKGMAVGFLTHLFGNESIYTLALLISLWVSIPAWIWMSMRSVGALTSYANRWYKSTTLIMIIILLGSFILFPPAGQGAYLWGGIRLFVAAAIPVHAIQYWFFTKGGLPTNYAATLGAIALAFFLYGLLVI